MSTVSGDCESMERRIAWFVALVFAASNLYYFHRWVFRFSNDDTSPTYTDTPFSWQFGKYVLVALAAAGMWVWVWAAVRETGRWCRLTYRPTAGFAPTLALLSLYTAIVVAIHAGAAHVRELASMIFFVPVVLLLPLCTLSAVSIKIYRNVGLVLIGYHAMFTAVQVIAYVSLDRTPALGYRGGLVRFGGGLDDPNGLGIMIVLPILVTIAMWGEFRRRWRAVALAATLVVLLCLPLSFSTFAGCAAGVITLAVITRRLRFLGITAIAAGVVLVLILFSEYVRDIIDEKSTSALGRFNFGSVGNRPGLTDFLSDLTVGRLLFGAPLDDVQSEIAYVRALANLGAIGLAGIVALVVIAWTRAMAAAHSAHEAGDAATGRLFQALAAYVVAFAVGSLGIPYFEVFPANMLFWLVAMLSSMGPHFVAARNDRSLTD